MFAAWRGHLSRKRARSGEAAMERGDWAQAQRLFSEALRLRPGRVELQTQLGHASKEMGSIENAVRHYERAAMHDDDALYHLCVLHAERGERDRAGHALNRLLARSPESADGFRLLATYGLADELPASLLHALSRGAQSELSQAIDHVANLVQRARVVMSASEGGYDAVRSTLIPDAPVQSDAPELRVIVDAQDGQPYHLRSTLFSLMDSAHQNWRASIVMNDPKMDHPVMSMIDLDPRFDACTADTMPNDDGIFGILYTSAGISFHPQALGWFAYLCSNNNTTLWTCDWDFKTPYWDRAPRYSDPALHGAFDLDLLMVNDAPPPVVAIAGTVVPDVSLLSTQDRRVSIAGWVMDGLDTAHIPLPLVSVTRIPERADQAREKGESLSLWPAGWREGALALAGAPKLKVTTRNGRPPLTCGVAQDDAADVRVIIPTRNCGEMLRDMIDSLRDCADHADHVKITVVDNRSTDDVTTSLLARWQESGAATIIQHDASFNWAHMNNLAVSRSEEPLLVFANNDMRMLSTGWDTRIKGQLARPDVGVVGARLLYPDGSLQHAGMMLGLAEGAPVHMGVYGADARSADDTQYDRVRSVSSVTGAFMGVSRQWFEAIGGFDAFRFPVAYNDVDFCLGSRARGRKILFDPGVELLHFESLSRGLNDNRTKIAWDQGELAGLFSKWGRFSVADPYMSPLQVRPALRRLSGISASAVKDHIDIAANRYIDMGPRREDDENVPDTARKTKADDGKA